MESSLIKGKCGLVIGVANEHSIAAGCAHAFHDAGARLALTYLNDKALPHVKTVADQVNAELLLPMDITNDTQLDALFEDIEKQWGGLDFLVHSIAWCPMEDLHGRVTDCSREGFLQAMDISCHSLIRLAHKAEPLLQNNGSIMTMSYYGAEKVVDHYNVMGPVKAALEASMKYLAAELGPSGIRVNAISPGPLNTRAASGIAHFDKLIDEHRTRAPQRHLVSIHDVGNMATYLACDASSRVTGEVIHVDAGYHVMS